MGNGYGAIGLDLKLKLKSMAMAFYYTHFGFYASVPACFRTHI